MEKFDNIDAGIGKMQDQMAKILTNQDTIHDKLFVDNGVKSYQTFRRVTESFMKIHLWVYGLMVSAVILTAVGVSVTRLLSK
jgi:hypothetical protein